MEPFILLLSAASLFGGPILMWLLAKRTKHLTVAHRLGIVAAILVVPWPLAFLTRNAVWWTVSPLSLWYLAFAFWPARKKPASRFPQIYTARYASETDTTPMNVDTTQVSSGDALLLGVAWQSVVGLKGGHGNRRELGHTLLAAPTRSGKGRNLVANLLNWQESVVVLDIKGENYTATAGFRKTLGRVYALNPRGIGDRYDPFAELRHSDEALLTAAKLMVEDKDDEDRAFGERAANGIYAALLAARLEDTPTLPFLNALLSEGIDDYIKRLAAYKDPKVDKALTLFLGYKPDKFSLERFASDRFLNSTWSLLSTRAAPMLTDGVLAMTGGSDFKAADFYDQHTSTSLYLIFPESESEATGKIFKLIVLSLVMGMIRAYDEAPIPPQRRILLALDEVGRTPVPRLSDYMSTVAGRNISVMLLVQSLSQLEDIYGRAGAETILDNCRTQIFYPTPNVKTQEHVSKLGGIMQYDERSYGSSVTRTPDQESIFPLYIESYTNSVNTRLAKVELIQPSTVRTMPPDTVWIFTADLQPIFAHRMDPMFLADAVLGEAKKLKAPVLPSLTLPSVSLPPLEPEPATPTDRVTKARMKKSAN